MSFKSLKSARVLARHIGSAALAAAICVAATPSPSQAETPDYFVESEKLFVDWLKEHGSEMKSEYYIPFAVNTFINRGYATMRVLKTTAQWFGVTYKEDRPLVQQALRELHAKGVYPEKL